MCSKSIRTSGVINGAWTSGGSSDIRVKQGLMGHRNRMYSRVAPIPEAPREWRDLSTFAWQHLHRNRLTPLDIFLVGSAARDEGPANDLDSVIILGADLSIRYLQYVREQLSDALTKQGLPSYHFKLFTLSEWKRFAKYDGVRLLEFQIRHISLCHTRLISGVTPRLSPTTFQHSMLIQTVYEYFSNPTHQIPPDGLACTKTRARASRNADLYKKWVTDTAQYDADTIVHANTQNPVYSLFSNAVQRRSLKDLRSAVHAYFKLFPHEYVNKYSQYVKAIDLCFRAVTEQPHQPSAAMSSPHL